jgi:hypothetical protein
MPDISLPTAAALKVYRRLLLADPGSDAERVLTEQLAFHVDHIPDEDMAEYATQVVATVKRVRRG